jgi:hypothetical protein
MQYLDNLKEKLTELSTITDKLTDLENQKDVIRSQIDKWLILNGIDHFEGYDKNNQIWKIWKSTSTRNSISDYMILKEVLGTQNEHLVVEKEVLTLNVRKAKKFSPEWLAEKN